MMMMMAVRPDHQWAVWIQKLAKILAKWPSSFYILVIFRFVWMHCKKSHS